MDSAQMKRERCRARPGRPCRRWASFGGDPLAYFEHLAADYGDYVRMKMIRGEGALLVDPDAIEEVLVRKKRHFIKGRSTRSLGALLGKGLLVSEGDFWRRQRRFAQPAFHKDRIARYAERMVALGAARWSTGGKRAAVMDVHDEMVQGDARHRRGCAVQRRRLGSRGHRSDAAWRRHCGTSSGGRGMPSSCRCGCPSAQIAASTGAKQRPGPDRERPHRGADGKAGGRARRRPARHAAERARRGRLGHEPEAGARRGDDAHARRATKPPQTRSRGRRCCSAENPEVAEKLEAELRRRARRPSADPGRPAQPAVQRDGHQGIDAGLSARVGDRLRGDRRCRRSGRT